MLAIHFFHDIDPDPPLDGVFYGIGYTKSFQVEEWRSCEVHLSGGTEAYTHIANYPPHRRGFEEMIQELHANGVAAVYAYHDQMRRLDSYALYLPNLFIGMPDLLNETVQLPRTLARTISEGSGRTTIQ